MSSLSVWDVKPLLGMSFTSIFSRSFGRLPLHFVDGFLRCAEAERAFDSMKLGHASECVAWCLVRVRSSISSLSYMLKL